MDSKGLFVQGATLVAVLLTTVVTQAYADGTAYTMTNSADDNQIVVFSRDDNGFLAKLDTISTGGKGSGFSSVD